MTTNKKNKNVKQMADKVLNSLTNARNQNKDFASIPITHIDFETRALLQVSLNKFGFKSFIVLDEKSAQLYVKA